MPLHRIPDHGNRQHRFSAMADANTRARSLAAELASKDYQADDLHNLARNVYVRSLLKVHSVGGRTASAKSVALTVTANVLKQLVGFHFTPAEVQSLLDEEAAPEPEPPSPAEDPGLSPPPRRAPPR
jgi:hypothetical protein